MSMTDNRFQKPDYPSVPGIRRAGFLHAGRFKICSRLFVLPGGYERTLFFVQFILCFTNQNRSLWHIFIKF